MKSSANYPVIEYYLQSFSNFATNANAKLYVGGGVVNNTTAHDRFGGKIHSVRFFEGALSGNEIAMIDYTKIPNDVAVNNVDEFIKGGVYTFITARGLMGATAENGNAISAVVPFSCGLEDRISPWAKPKMEVQIAICCPYH